MYYALIPIKLVRNSSDIFIDFHFIFKNHLPVQLFTNWFSSFWLVLNPLQKIWEKTTKYWFVTWSHNFYIVKHIVLEDVLQQTNGCFFYWFKFPKNFFTNKKSIFFQNIIKIAISSINKPTGINNSKFWCFWLIFFFIFISIKFHQPFLYQEHKILNK